MELIPGAGSVVEQLGVLGLLLVALIIVLMRQNAVIRAGKLVPRPTHEEIANSYRERVVYLEEAVDSWRAAHEESEKARSRSLAIAEQSLGIQEDNSQILKAIRELAQETRLYGSLHQQPPPAGSETE